MNKLPKKYYKPLWLLIWWLVVIALWATIFAWFKNNQLADCLEKNWTVIVNNYISWSEYPLGAEVRDVVERNDYDCNKDDWAVDTKFKDWDFVEEYCMRKFNIDGVTWNSWRVYHNSRWNNRSANQVALTSKYTAKQAYALIRITDFMNQLNGRKDTIKKQLDEQLTWVKQDIQHINSFQKFLGFPQEVDYQIISSELISEDELSMIYGDLDYYMNVWIQ
jgi:hypothetical protein